MKQEPLLNGLGVVKKTCKNCEVL